MRFFLGVFCIGCTMLIGSPCWAAITIQPVQGNFFINHGEGFQPLNGPIEVVVGDAIMVSPGNLAVVVYPDGCKVSVAPGGVVTVAPRSPCSNPFGGPAQTPTYAQDAPPNYAWAIAGVGILGAAGIGAGIYALTKNDNDDTNTGLSCGTKANPCFIISP